MENNEHRNDLGAAIRRLKEWCAANIRWFTRTALFLLAAFIIVHQFNPTLAEKLATFLHFAEPSLEAIIALILTIMILERTFILEDTIRQPVLHISDRVKGDINRPVQDQEIRDTFLASGTARGLQHGLHLWLAIEIEGRIWPKEGGLLVEDDGSWSTTVFEEGTAEYVSLSLFAANDEGHDYLRSWLRECDQKGNYPELRRTTGMRRLARVDGLSRRQRAGVA